MKKNEIKLSDYGLKPIMTLLEINHTIRYLKLQFGEPKFYSVAQLTYSFLRGLQKGERVDYNEIFKTENDLKIFFPVAFRFMTDNQSVLFTDDYKQVKRNRL